MILTDDQRSDTLPYMPNVERDLVSRGELFTQAFVSNPLCCPSRAAILTGNYSHTTHVYSNTGAHGGWHVFHEAAESSTIATWLHAAGYRTALIGKYMNKYGPDERFVPPGWDRWVAFDQREGRYFDYTLNRNGNLVTYGSDPQDYSTDVLAKDAVDWVAKQHGPFFLLFAPFAPHEPSEPAPRDVGTEAAAALPQPPSLNEPDVADKPNYVKRSGLQDESLLAADWRNMVESLGAVDDAVGRIFDTLAATHQLGDTMFVFTSDNGLLFGEHRWKNKLVPYEESIHVPLVIRYDPLTDPNLTDDHLVVNVDFAPTFASLAGVDHPATEGRDLTPILGTSDPPWRRAFLLEHLWVKRTSGKENVPTYCGLRTPRLVFIRYATGFEELYNLATDPYELRNLAGTASDARLERLRAKTRTMCSPLPPEMPPF
jgi:N-acetylglucosamine-6-sulfatase